jgi:hypothetical protein
MGSVTARTSTSPSPRERAPSAALETPRSRSPPRSSSAPTLASVATTARGAEKVAPSGTVSTELEVDAADTQAIDFWFEPDPEHEAKRSRAGLLGRMGEGPTMFEPFHDPPGLDEMRACLRKQLTLDHARALEARKRGEPRPPFPRCWVLSAGRPEGVIAGYNLTPMPGWLAGLYEGDPAEATGVVVLRELPRKRSTLLLRLMGAGAVLRAAIEDLKRLPARA